VIRSSFVMGVQNLCESIWADARRPKLSPVEGIMKKIKHLENARACRWI